MIETEAQRHGIHALYLQEYPKLLAYARSLLHDESLAKEAVQDTFLIACKKPEALLDHPNPPGWLMQALKYTIHNMIRGRAILTSFSTTFSNVKNNEITLINSSYTTNDTSITYSKDAGSPETYTAGGVKHSILTNIDSYGAVWYRENCECFIYGYESKDDLIKTIDSLYMEVQNE